MIRLNTANELNNHQRHALLSTLSREILHSLQQMLHTCNPYVSVFQQAGEIIRDQPIVDLTLKIKTDMSGRDARCSNRPTGSEVTAIMPGDGSEVVNCCDIVLCSRQSALQCISETASCYDLLHCVLMFPYGTTPLASSMLVCLKWAAPTALKCMRHKQTYYYKLLTAF